MAYSEVEIVNIALSALGREAIRDFTDQPDDPKSGRLSNRIYKIVRDSLLSSHDWSFARKTVTLYRDASVEHPEGVLFKLPSDCFTPRRLGPRKGKPNRFRIEAGGVLIPSDLIATYGETPYLRYTMAVTATGTFPPHFVDALALAIASRLAMPITRDKKLKDTIDRDASIALGRALFTDSNLDSGDDRIDMDLEFDTFIEPEPGGTLFNG